MSAETTGVVHCECGRDLHLSVVLDEALLAQKVAANIQATPRRWVTYPVPARKRHWWQKRPTQTMRMVEDDSP